jgi:hypothetical protein
LTLRGLVGFHPPVPGLSRSEALVLAAVARRRGGVASGREAARLAGVAPGTGVKALTALVAAGYVVTDDGVYLANREHPNWATLAPHLAHTRPPAPPRTRPHPHPARVAPIDVGDGLTWVAPHQRAGRTITGYWRRR